jgi:hypothetical protein
MTHAKRVAQKNARPPDGRAQARRHVKADADAMSAAALRCCARSEAANDAACIQSVKSGQGINSSLD